MRIEFFIPFPVRPKNSRRAFMVKGKPRVVENPDTVDNAQSLASLCMPYRPEKPIEGPITVSYTFQYKWRKGDKRRGDVRKVSRPDLGNLTKQMDDVLCECGFFNDDAQISEYREVRKMWWDEDGVEVIICG